EIPCSGSLLVGQSQDLGNDEGRLIVEVHEERPDAMRLGRAVELCRDVVFGERWACGHLHRKRDVQPVREYASHLPAARVLGLLWITDLRIGKANLADCGLDRRANFLVELGKRDIRVAGNVDVFGGAVAVQAYPKSHSAFEGDLTLLRSLKQCSEDGGLQTLSSLKLRVHISP